ncbi:MAG: S41 family peptidase [Bacteroidota bacterium]
MKIIENNSIRIDSVDWNAIKQESYNSFSTNESFENAHLIVKNVLQKLNDRHSTFWESATVEKIHSNVESTVIRFEVLHDSVGYIEVPSFSGFNDLRVNYWIIDLRNNSGGNMWPMISGLSPFFRKDTLGYVMDRDKRFSPWYVKFDGVFSDTVRKSQLDSFYKLENPWKKIAIIINGKTASAAEAIVVSFKSLPDVKFFGKPTYGVSSANTDYTLSDGSLLLLTTHIMADRTKKLYGKRIMPDVYTEHPKEDAIKWFLEIKKQKNY